MDFTLDVEDIRALLPHRYPLLLVDRILEVEPGERIVGLKNVTINEPFFNGHFPGQAVMPGVLIVESMAQVAGLMILLMPEHRGKLAYIGAIENARFRRPVVPGDTLLIEASVVKLRSAIGKVRMVARVGNEIAAECDLTFALKERRDEDDTQARLERIGQGRNGATESAGGRPDGTVLAHQ
jgi:3-hydroxyacyl-[acyl-carrier-protein] dehydratase